MRCTFHLFSNSGMDIILSCFRRDTKFLLTVASARWLRLSFSILSLDFSRDFNSSTNNTREFTWQLQRNKRLNEFSWTHKTQSFAIFSLPFTISLTYSNNFHSLRIFHENAPSFVSRSRLDHYENTASWRLELINCGSKQALPIEYAGALVFFL